jgi:hypothetical protein
LILAMGLIGCFRTESEVARVANPTGDVEAVVVETNGGATTSFGYEIHVVPPGKRAGSASLVAVIYGATRNENAYGVDLVWATPTLVTVRYLDAKNERLITPEIRVGGRAIWVVLEAGFENPAAPGAGMLYNLPRKP